MTTFLFCPTQMPKCIIWVWFVIFLTIPGKYRKGSIKAGSYEPFVWKSGRFRYIKPKKITFAKLQITDRARRKWVTYLTRDAAQAAQEKFFEVQSQNTRESWASHSHNPW